MTRRLLPSLLVIAACNQPGEITVLFDTELPPLAATALIYVIDDLACPCRCGACADRCVDGSCQVACDGARCAIDDLDGLTLAPAAGPSALVLDFYDDEGALVGSACANLSVNVDGASSAVTAIVDTCP